MIKVLLILLALTTAAYAENYVLPNGGGFIQYSGDQIVKSGKACIRNVIVGFKGVTAGDYVQILDGVSATSTVDATIYASTANGSVPGALAEPFTLDNGIYIHEVKTGGAFYTSLQIQ